MTVTGPVELVIELERTNVVRGTPGAISGRVVVAGVPAAGVRVSLVLSAASRPASGGVREWDREVRAIETGPAGTFEFDAPPGPLSFDGSTFFSRWRVVAEHEEARASAIVALCKVPRDSVETVPIYAFGVDYVALHRARTNVASPSSSVGGSGAVVAIGAPLLALSLAAVAVIKPALWSIQGPVFGLLVLMLTGYAIVFRKRPAPPAPELAARVTPELAMPGGTVELFVEGATAPPGPAVFSCEEVIALFGGLERKREVVRAEVPFRKDNEGFVATYTLPDDAETSLVLPEHIVRWTAATTVAATAAYRAELEFRVGPREGGSVQDVDED